MLRGAVLTSSRPRFPLQMVLRADYTIFVFDEALVIAPVGSFERLRFLATGLPGLVGPILDLTNRFAGRKEAAKLEHNVEEIPPDITVEQLVEHFDHAHVVPSADIASLLVTSRLVGGAYLRVRFSTPDVDRYARKRLNRQRQLLSDPVRAGTLLTQAFGDKVIDKRRASHKEHERPPA